MFQERRIYVKLKFQMRLLCSRREFKFALLFTIMLCMAIFILDCSTYFGKDISQVVSADQLFIGRATSKYSFIFRLLVPLVITIPFVDSYFCERKNNILPIILIRCKNRRTFYWSKLIAVFFSAVSVVLIPQVIHQILLLVAFPMESIIDYSNWSTDQSSYYSHNQQILFEKIFIENPYLYNVVFFVSLSTIFGFIAILLFNISFFIKKTRLLILTLPIIIVNLLEIVSVPLLEMNFNISIMDYLFSYDLSPAKQSNIIIFGVTFIMISNIILSFAIKKKLCDVM